MPRTSTWSPGQSGNPGSRPKLLKEVRDLAREHTEAAITTLTRIMGDEDAPAAARVLAAENILNRGWGKAPNFGYIESRTAQLRDLAPDWLRQHLADRPEPLLIEGEAQDEEVDEDWFLVGPLRSHVRGQEPEVAGRSAAHSEPLENQSSKGFKTILPELSAI